MVGIDTSFAIDILRGNIIAKEIMYKLVNSKESIKIPTPVIMELISGLNNSQYKEKEKNQILSLISSIDVMDFDLNSSILAGEIEIDLIKNGITIETEDIMIAAIAIENNETLITRNVKHFEKIKDLKIKSY